MKKILTALMVTTVLTAQGHAVDNLLEDKKDYKEIPILQSGHEIIDCDISIQSSPSHQQKITDQEKWMETIKPYTQAIENKIFLGFLDKDDNLVDVKGSKISFEDTKLILEIGGNVNDVFKELNKKQKLQDIIFLDLSHSGVTTKDLEILKECKNLYALNLSYTPVTKKIFEFLSENIEYLNLTNVSNIKGGIDSLKRFNKLQVIGLAGTNLTKNDLESLEYISNHNADLKKIDLSLSKVNYKKIVSSMMSHIDDRKFIFNRSSQEVHGSEGIF